MALGVVFTVHIAGLRPVHHIILTPAPTPVGQQRMVHTEAGALARPTIPTPGPTLPPDKVRVRMALGASPSYLRETDRPMPSMFRLRMVLWDRSRVQKAEPQLALRPSTGTPPWPKPPAVTCMPPTMATFIRTPVQVGTNTTMATGIRFSNPQRTLKTVRKAPRVRTELAIRLQRSNELKIVRGFKIPREASRKEASIGRAAQASATWIRISRTATVGNFRVSVLIASKGAEAAGAVLSVEGDAALAALAAGDASGLDKMPYPGRR